MEWVVVLRWLVACALLGALGLPIASFLCPRLPDRGATIALPGALTVVALVTYWIGRVTFGPLAIALGVLVLGLAAVVSYRAEGELPAREYSEALVVFTAGFTVAVLVRATNPAIVPGTENFLNYGLLQALLRTPVLPPEDMWYAGERVHYYYGGHLIAAIIARLTATPARFAYNLALPVFYGTLLTAAYGAGGAIIADRDVSTRFAGGLAAFFVGLASNLFAPIQLLLHTLPAAWSDPVITWLGIPPRALGEYSIYAPVHFSFTNTDFPIYSVILGTLHAHVMSTPFLLLGIVLLIAYYRTRKVARRRRLLAAIVPVAFLIGVINTWSFPTLLGLVAVTLALAPGHPRSLLPNQWVPTPTHAVTVPTHPGWDELASRSALAGGIAGVLGVVAVGIGLPFFLDGTPPGIGIGILPERAPWHYFVLAYGAVLFVFALYLFPRIDAQLGARTRRIGLAVLGGLGAVGLLGGIHGLVIVAPVGIAALYLLLADTEIGYEAVLVVAGTGLVLVVELLYVEEPAEPGRFNTAYKTHMQAWLIWGVAAGASLARLVDDIPNPSIGLLGDRWRAEVLVIVLVSLLSVYGVGWVVTSGLQPGVTPGLTLDGVSTLRITHGDQIAGVEWLLERPGRPRIASAPAEGEQMYSFNASIAASLTGFPTIVGWAHQRDYRNTTEYRQRVAHADAVYIGTPRERAYVLKRYEIEYVWVGPGEYHRYGTLSLSDEEPWLTEAFHHGNVTIYAVNRSVIPD